ncbi:MAG: radical SAM protein [Elusimicrobiota bacterium]
MKVLYKRLKADLFYRVKPETAPLPEAVTLFLTHNCNLRCKMCGQWGDRGVTKHKDELKRTMDYSQLEKLIAELASFKPNITLFGGEPLLHQDVIRIVKSIKESGMHCIMITNGYLLEKYAEELVQIGIDEINISIDGVGEMHDRIRGIDGLYDKIYSGIKKVARVRHSKKPLINIQTTITRYNYEELDRLLPVLDDMGADSITFHHLIYLEENDIRETKEKFPDLKAGDWEGFVSDPGIDTGKLINALKRIKELSSKYSFMVNVYPNFNKEEIEKYYKDDAWFPDSYTGRCKSPWICVYVFPDGELRPCLNFQYSFGNLNESGFKEIWNGETAGRFRAQLMKEKKFPVCRRCTEIFRY